MKKLKKVDWKNVSPKEIQALLENMFDAANTPVTARDNYYRELNRYIYGLKIGDDRNGYFRNTGYN